jgi:predicted transcriptional regulator YdeE
MENYTFEEDINVICITASSFPEGVMAAHQKLHTLVPFSTDRRYFGLSRPENGSIVYKAAAEGLSTGEADALKCERIVLPKGKYVSVTVHDYMNDLPAIGKIFSQLIALPDIDPRGYCVEWYLDKTDVICMVRLN